ncbi:glycosyltransferase family 2 protein [Streptosporangiaceae bacterium NEAU-GS5]|nr:glycosyltransferase family 2 protein [Streptosporangiaceae bacterium NEAU-GS5]
MSEVTPSGFLRTPSTGLADLLWSDGWHVPEVDLRLPAPLEDVTALRGMRGLTVAWPAEPVPMDVVAGLAKAGVPMTSPVVPEWARAADPALAALLEDQAWLSPPPSGGMEDVTDLRREEHSIRLRRHGRHSTAAVRPSVSVVMASRRPHLLEHAIGQLSRQRDVDIELLLAPHGYTPPSLDAPFPVTVVEAPESILLGEVLNRAAAQASGQYVAKWDDDDWYGPQHLSDLLMARAYAQAEVVGVAQEFFYLEPLGVTVRRTDYSSEVETDHVAGGSILLDLATFKKIGGFGETAASEDAHLLRSAIAHGARVYRTHGLGYVLRRGAARNHSWQLPLKHFLRVAGNQWRGFRPSLILEWP